MLKNELKQLKGANSFPCISIIIPTQRKFPQSKQNETMIKNQIREIKNILQKKLDKKEAEEYLAKIQALEKHVDYNHPLDSLCLFVSKDISKEISLPFQAKETATVDSSFQIRDIVYTLNRSFSYTVLLLSEKNLRIFHGLDDKVSEFFPKDLPKSVEEYIDGPLMDDNRYSYQDAKIFNNNATEKFFMDIDKFLKTHLGEQKNLVLMGVTDHIAEFTKLSKNKEKIYLTIEGNYDHFKEHEISELVRPKIIEKIDAEKEEVLNELGNAVSNGKYSSGLTQVWRDVASQKAHILLVEKNYAEPARKGEDEFIIYTDKIDPNSSEYISDAVDDIIEKMVENNGRVCFVDEGKLETHQKIAVITKY